MKLSTLKFSQGTEYGILTLAEQKWKCISSDPKLQKPDFLSYSLGTTCSPVLTPITGTTLGTTVSIQNSMSFLILQLAKRGWNIACFTTSSSINTWKVTAAGAAYTFVWRPVTQSYANDMADICWTSRLLLLFVTTHGRMSLEAVWLQHAVCNCRQLSHWRQEVVSWEKNGLQKGSEMEEKNELLKPWLASGCTMENI